MWIDLQEAFYILFGEYLQNLLLPVFVASGVLLAIVNPLSRFWQPTDTIKLPGWGRDN